MNKKIWKIRKDKNGVSPVIATILMVAITVVLAAVLYVMVGQFIPPDEAGLLTGDLSYLAANSDPKRGNATFHLTMSNPDNPYEENVRITLLDSSGIEATGTSVTWTHLVSNPDRVKSGDRLFVSYWPNDISGYEVAMSIPPMDGSISDIIPS